MSRDYAARAARISALARDISQLVAAEARRARRCCAARRRRPTRAWRSSRRAACSTRCKVRGVVEPLLRAAGFTLTPVDRRAAVLRLGRHLLASCSRSCRSELLRTKVQALEAGRAGRHRHRQHRLSRAPARRHVRPGASLGRAARGEARRMADQWGERMPRSVGLLQTHRRLGGHYHRQRHLPRAGHGCRAAARTAGPCCCAGCWAGVIALCGALTVAELAGALPRSGGIFAYLLEGYGPLPAFLFGWTELMVIRASALGRHRHDLRRVPGVLRAADLAAQVRQTAAARHRAHRGDQLRRRAARRGGAERHHGAQVRGAAGARCCSPSPRSGGSVAHFAPAWPAGPAAVAAGHRADPGDVDLRRLGGPGVHGGRDQQPAAQPAAGAHQRRAVCHGGVPGGQRRLPVRAARRRRWPARS